MDWLYFTYIGYLLRYLIPVRYICTSYRATISVLFLSAVFYPDCLLPSDQLSYWKLLTLLRVYTIDQT